MKKSLGILLNISLFFIILIGGESIFDSYIRKVYGILVFILASTLSYRKTFLSPLLILKRDLGDMIINAMDKKVLRAIELADASDATDLIDASVRHVKIDRDQIEVFIKISVGFFENLYIYLLYIYSIFLLLG